MLRNADRLSPDAVTIKAARAYNILNSEKREVRQVEALAARKVLWAYHGGGRCHNRSRHGPPDVRVVVSACGAAYRVRTRSAL